MVIYLCSQNYSKVEALVSRHPQGAKKCLYVELAANKNVKIQYLSGSFIKQGFD